MSSKKKVIHYSKNGSSLYVACGTFPHNDITAEKKDVTCKRCKNTNIFKNITPPSPFKVVHFILPGFKFSACGTQDYSGNYPQHFVSDKNKVTCKLCSSSKTFNSFTVTGRFIPSVVPEYIKLEFDFRPKQTPPEEKIDIDSSGEWDIL